MSESDPITPPQPTDLPMLLRSPTFGELVGALAKARAKFDEPKKDGRAKFKTRRGDTVEFSYSSLPELYRCTAVQLAEQGLVVMHQIIREIYCLTSLLHSSGEWMASMVVIGMPEDWKEWGGGLTYAKRNCMKGLLGIEGDDDLDAPEGGVGGGGAPTGARQAGARSRGENQGNQGRATPQPSGQAQAYSEVTDRIRATIREDNLNGAYLAELRNRLVNSLEEYRDVFAPAVEQIQGHTLPEEGWRGLMADLAKCKTVQDIEAVAQALDAELNKIADEGFDGTADPPDEVKEPMERAAAAAAQREQDEQQQRQGETPAGMRRADNSHRFAQGAGRRDPDNDDPEPAQQRERSVDEKGRKHVNPKRLEDNTMGAKAVDTKTPLGVGEEVLVVPKTGSARPWPAVVIEVIGMEDDRFIARTATREKWKKMQEEAQREAEEAERGEQPEIW